MNIFQKNTFYSLLLMLAVIAFNAPAFAAETYQLRNQYQKGQTAYLILNTTTEGVTTIGENQLKINNGINITLSFETAQVDPPDTATVNMDIKKMEMTEGTPGMMRSQDMKKMLKMDDVKYTYKINALGKVLESPKKSDSKGLGQTMMSPGGQNPNERMPWLPFPGKAVAIGDSWNDTRTVPIPGTSKPIVLHATYTLASVSEKNGDKIARIDIQSQILEKDVKVDPAAAGENLGKVEIKFVFKEYTSIAKGTCEFSLTKGHLISLEDASTMKISLGQETKVNDASFPSNFVHDYKVFTVGRYAESLPDATPEKR